MFIIRAVVNQRAYYFAGVGTAPEWSPDEESAQTYPSEDAARAALIQTSPVYIRYTAVARVVPA